MTLPPLFDSPSVPLNALWIDAQEACHEEIGGFAGQCISERAAPGILFCRSEFFAGLCGR
jgi:hypothetical protein